MVTLQAACGACPAAGPAAPFADLPVARLGSPWRADDLVLSLRLAASAEVMPADDECARWQIQPSAANDVNCRYLPWDEALAQIKAAVKASAETPGYPEAHEATVCIRTPRAAPWSVVSRLVQACAASGAHRLAFAVAPADGTASERRIDMPLPLDRGGSFLAERYMMLTVEWDPKSGEWMHRCNELGGEYPVDADDVAVNESGNKTSAKPWLVPMVEPIVLPRDTRMDARLRGFLQQCEAQWTQRHAIGSACVRGEGDVPWQQIVHAIDRLQGIGQTRIGIGTN